MGRLRSVYGSAGRIDKCGKCAESHGAVRDAGGLKEDIGSETEALGVKYWGEVIGTSISGQTFSVTIMQPEKELAERSVEIIKKRLKEQASVIAKTHGKFKLSEQDTSFYTKSEAGIINTQNSRRNDLKNSRSQASDLEAKLFNQQNTLDQYIENNRPDTLEVKQVSVKKTVCLFAAIGLLLSFWIALGCVLIDYIAGNRVRREEDLKKYGLEILGVNELKKGAVPDVSQTALGIRALAGRKGNAPEEVLPGGGVTLYNISEAPDAETICAEYAAELDYPGFPASCVKGTDGGAEALKEFITHGNVVIFASAGDTRLADVRNALEKIKQYQLRCLGAIVLK